MGMMLLINIMSSNSIKLKGRIFIKDRNKHPNAEAESKCLRWAIKGKTIFIFSSQE
jgi:hypothetical protein